MRVGNRLAKVVLLALAALWLAASASAQGQPTAPKPAPQKAAAPAKAAPTPNKAKPAPATKTASPAAPKTSQPKAVAKTRSKTKHVAKARPAAKPKSKPAQPTEAKATRPQARGRDPFQSLIALRTETGSNLPPGKAGLVVGAIRLDGTVRGPSGMIAVVSNPQLRVYFIREGDQLYDGNVEKISMDEVVFRERSKDAFGKPVERLVTKRLYATAGELQ